MGSGELMRSNALLGKIEKVKGGNEKHDEVKGENWLRSFRKQNKRGNTIITDFIF